MFLQLFVFPHRGTQRLKRPNQSTARVCSERGRGRGPSKWSRVVVLRRRSLGPPASVAPLLDRLDKEVSRRLGGGRLDAVAEVHDVRPASHLLEDVLRARGSRERTWRRNRSQ